MNGCDSKIESNINEAIHQREDDHIFLHNKGL